MKFPLIPVMAFPLVALAQEPASTSLDVRPSDILSTRTVHDGKRRITLQKLDPVAMERKAELRKPAPPLPPVIPIAPASGEVSDGKPVRLLLLGASVHIADPSKPDKAVTLLQLWPNGGGQPVASIWVDANFLWLTGAPPEIETESARHNLMLMVSEGVEAIPPNLPFFNDGKSTLVIKEGNPTDEALEPLLLLLDLYDRDQVQLRARYEARQKEAARLAAERLADPPENKDLIIRYWQSDPAKHAGTVREGGAR